MVQNVVRFFTKIDYLLRETFLGLRRGGWMNWAAISTVAVLLFLFGASLQLSWQLENVLGQLGSQLEISVYLDENTVGESMQSRLLLVDGVASAKLIAKEDAWENLIKDLGATDLSQATQQLGGNPLVDEFKVRAVTSDRVPDVAKRIAGLKGINEVWYTNEVVERIGQLRQALSNSSVAIVAIFTVIAIAVITTTIRLIVLARRREIEVMQLVGATAVWIYFPFVLQGIFFGITGAATAYVMLMLSLNLLGDAIVNQPELIKSLTLGLTTDLRVQFLLPMVLGIFGSIIGVLGSLLAVRRFSFNS
ncbi:cell division protein FtsX [Pseudanabaena mucicola]|uniref:Cell division protein FtsX n=1 Tax=Pseudanabaena mucicola FACHB-723 TaxID=2692860 RepID=A0ABR7ZTW9_9CYAN|nr:permease-like cell division protein FtsX [Pseudanabaena mucicola]MBD2187229.1 ABC transporter permease [Pseudanabaena mucicola FACHB-723]